MTIDLVTIKMAEKVEIVKLKSATRKLILAEFTKLLS